MRDEILLECIDCKDSYIGTTHTDGYRCPRCGGGYLIARGKIKELEENMKATKTKIRSARWNGNIRDATERARLKRVDYDITCLAMAIVNDTNEVNGVSVETRQSNNDKCFDFAEDKIKEFLDRKPILKLKFPEYPIPPYK